MNQGKVWFQHQAGNEKKLDFMKTSLWDKRIPTLLGLFIITLAIGATSYLVGQTTFLTGRASPTSNPQNVRITNISDTSVSISYTTEGFILGTLNFGKDTNLGQTVIDEKDNDQIKEHKIHSFTINNLSPSTKYFFAITSAEQIYLNNGVPYEVTTGPTLKSTGNVGFIVGKVVAPDGKNPNEAEVFATSEGVSPLSANVKKDGTYTISLEKLRKEDLSAFATLKGSSLIKLLVVSDSGSSTVTIQAKGINNVPPIVLSQNYDFGEEETPTPSPITGEGLPKVSQGKAGDSPKILTPTESQTFKDQKPKFAGTAVPNDKVKIIIQSEVIQSEVTTDSSGAWSFQPTTPLPPGEHTITITAKDNLGILRTITRTFTIQPAEAASAPSPSPSPSPSVSPQPTVSPLPTPTLSPIPSETPVIIATPTPVSLAQLPATGTGDVSTGVLGIAAAVAGLVFLILSKLLL